jgi:hypothetical protein
MMGNALVYETDKSASGTPMDYYIKAASILENILLEKYEKAGIEVFVNPNEQIKRNLVAARASDDDSIKEVKGILADLYQRIEDAKLEEHIKKEYDEVKRRQEAENKQALNAFGKPIEETDEKKVKKLGVFGRSL